MDLSTGPGLVMAIGDFLNRQDLATQVPAFVRLAEAQINRALRTRDQIKRSTAVTSDGFVDLPADFLELKSLQVLDPDGSRRVIDLTSNDDLMDAELDKAKRTKYITSPDVVVGPRLYSVIGKTMRIAPAPSVPTTLEMVYFASVPALDLTTPGSTNWLLTSAPDVYLFSALVFAAPFLGEDSRTELFAQMASSAVQQLNDQTTRAQNNGSRITKKIVGF